MNTSDARGFTCETPNSNSFNLIPAKDALPSSSLLFNCRVALKVGEVQLPKLLTSPFYSRRKLSSQSGRVAQAYRPLFAIALVNVVLARQQRTTKTMYKIRHSYSFIVWFYKYTMKEGEAHKQVRVTSPLIMRVKALSRLLHGVVEPSPQTKGSYHVLTA